MKKIPILLSTLTLVGATLTPLPVMAADITQTTTSDVLSYDLYALRPFIRITELDLGNNKFTYELGGTANIDGVRALKAMFVMRDYDNGVSEAEAEEELPTLGSGYNSGWYKVIYAQNNPALKNFVSLKKNPIRLDENLSDVIYFAVQFGHNTTDENGDDVIVSDYWVRGKIDYRSCIHSELYASGAKICQQDVDLNNKTVTMRPVDGSGALIIAPDDEVVLSWEEEWKQIIAERIEALNGELTHLKADLPALGTILANAGWSVDKMQVSASKMTDTQDLERDLAKLEDLVQQVQAIYDWLNGPKQAEVMNNMRADLLAAQAELEKLQQESGAVDADLIKLQQELDQAIEAWHLAQEKTQGLEGDLQAKQSELDIAKSEMEHLRQELATLQDKMTRTEADLNLAVADYDKAKSDMSGLQKELNEVRMRKEELTEKAMNLLNEKEGLVDQNRIMEQRITEFTQKEQTVEAKNRELTAKYDTLMAENRELVVKNEALTAENVELLAQIRQLEAALSEHTSCATVGEVRVGPAPLEKSGTEISADEQLDADSGEIEAIEVPNLGEVETETNWWWIMVAIVGALGVLGFCCKKRMDRER